MSHYLQQALNWHEQTLYIEEDLTAVTVWNCFSNLCPFAVWCELVVRLSGLAGTIYVFDKHNKYREVPLNATARVVLLA